MIAPMAAFISKKIENVKGKPTGACAQTAGELVVPFAAACNAAVQLGGTRTFKTAGAARGVEITTVPASHDSTVARALLSEPERKNLEADNVSISLGPPSGYVINFTNGLKVYLSGDTGIHAEMKTVVGDFHKANLAMMNLGPNAVTGLSAAYAINDLVQAGRRHRDARQRRRDGRRQVETDFAYRRVHEAGQGPAGVSGAERQDDGVRRQREVRRWVLERNR